MDNIWFWVILVIILFGLISWLLTKGKKANGTKKSEEVQGEREKNAIKNVLSSQVRTENQKKPEVNVKKASEMEKPKVSERDKSDDLQPSRTFNK